MSIRIDDDFMVCSLSTAEAERTEHGWKVSWLPGRTVDRNSAITALTLAEAVAAGARPGTKYWPHVRDWLDELGLGPADLNALPQLAEGGDRS